MQLAAPEIDGGGQAVEAAAGGDFTPCPVQFFGAEATAADFATIDRACGGFSHPLDERVAGDGGGVAGTDAGQSGHPLPGAAGIDAEEFLDGLAVELAGVHAAEHVENFWKTMKPSKLPSHPEPLPLLNVRERSGIMSFPDIPFPSPIMTDKTPCFYRRCSGTDSDRNDPGHVG